MAVIVKDLVFSYSNNYESQNVLNRVCLNVPKGSIYGLLGPSGCGKTTLLKTVTGLCKPTAGNVLVFGYKPGTKESGVPGPGVGYMPQELAVQLDLTIQEIMVYFGNILSMKKDDIERQIKFLIRTLELPEQSRIIETLSGGQRRRLSLAIAVLHNPRLLILDEPTVGVDPLLSQRIWNLLEGLSKNSGVTVIITTHYIEEAKKANFVGFMRKGEILEENSPSNVLKSYQSNTLEEVFHSLCYQRKKQRKSSVKSNRKGSFTVERSADPVKTPFRYYDIRKNRFLTVLLTIISKYISETRRNPFAMVMLITMSLLPSILVKLFLGQTPIDIPVGWVNEEPYFDVQCYNLTSFSTSFALIDCFNNNSLTTNYSIEANKDNEVIEIFNIPNYFKSFVDSEIIRIVNFADYETAYNELKRKRIHGIIHFNSNFSKSYIKSNPTLDFGEEWANTSLIKDGTIKLQLDVTNLVVSKTIEFSVQLSVIKFSQSVAAEYGYDERSAKPSFDVIPIFGEVSEKDFHGAIEFFAPGLIILHSYLPAVFVSIVGLLSDPDCDMSLRSFTCGVKPSHIIFGQILARFPFVLFSVFLNMFVSIYALDIPCRGSMSLSFAIISLFGLSGLTQGVLFANLVDNSAMAIIAIFGVINTFIFSNGVLWPAMSLPYFLRWTAPIMPYTYTVDTFRSLLVRENVPFHPIIWRGFASTTIWTVWPLFAAIVVVSRKT